MFKQSYYTAISFLLCSFWCIGLFISFPSSINAQDNIDDAINQIYLDLAASKTPEDSFLLLRNLGDNLFKYPEKDSTTFQVYLHTLSVAKRIQDVRGIIAAYSKITQMLMKRGQYDLLEEYLEKGLIEAKRYQKEYPDGIGTIYRSYHFYYYYIADYQKMLEYGELTLSFFKDKDNYKMTSNAYTDIGNAYFYLGDYQKALDNYINVVKLYEAGKNNLYQTYGNIADVHLIQNQREKAKEVLQKFLKAATESGNHRTIAIINYKLSKIALFDDDPESSLSYALESIKVNNNQHLTELIFANTYASTALSHLKRFPEALEYAFAASEILKTAPDIGQEAELEQSIGEIYMEMGEEAEAQKHFANSLRIAENKAYVHLQMRSTFELSKIEKNKGNFKASLLNLEQHIALKDSLFTVEKNQSVSELQTKYETEKTELENANLKQTNELIQARNQKYLIGGLILAGAVLLLGFFFVQLQRVKNQLATQNKIVAQKNNELTELDKIKSNFFANVSHELRTPLTLILGPLSRLLKSEKLDNTEFTMLKLMEQNGGNLLKLINEILDLSKIEANKLELKERPTVLYLFVQRLLASFESFAQKKSIDLVFEYQADTSLQINVDPNKLEKVINNLISNACKFTLMEDRVSLKIQDKGHQMEFEVSDTGRGIHKDDLSHIFNRFYQSKQADAQAEGGTGIGLALVNEFVKLFGGTISVKSELQKGSVFTFLIPKKEVLKSLETEDALAISAFENNEPLSLIKEESIIFDKEETSNSSSNNKKSTVLIVEDNYHLREYIQLILGEHYHTCTAENGQAALDWLNGLNNNNDYPDLIISDVMMPIMDGIELLSNLKKEVKFNKIPVVMLTAKASMENKLLALRIGVDDYMIKPFVEEELLARVENLLKHGLAKRQYIHEVENEEEQVLEGHDLLQKDEQQEAEPKIIKQRDLKWLADVEQKVLSAYTDFDFTLERLSEMIFLSPRQTRRRLKQLTGLSFSHYIREIRLTEARRMLENEEVNAVKQLAYEVGLKDVKYFSQQFKNRFGKSPSAYLTS